MNQTTKVVIGTTIAAVILAGVATFAISAVNSGAFAEPASTQSPTQPSTTNEDVYDFSDVAPGEALTPEQVEAVDAVHAHKAGSYELADGTHILVDPSVPLTDAVKADAAAKLHTPEQSTYSEQAINDAFVRIDGTLEQLSATSRKVIVVAKAYGYDYNENFAGYWNAFAPGGGNLLSSSSPSKAEAIATAEAHVASQSDSERWDIIVAQ